MNTRHRKTLEALFSTPVPTTLEWQSLEHLLLALGAQLIEGRGSRVRFVLHGVVATRTCTCTSEEARPWQVRDARAFLEQAGVKP